MIDAHHHLWRYTPSDYPWMDGDEKIVLRQDYGVADLERLVRPLGISKTVVVQARQTLEETRWLLHLSRQSEIIAAVVGWLPLGKIDVEASLEEFSGEGLLKSIRHVVQDEPDPNFLDAPEFNDGVSLLARHDLAYDILIYGRQLPMTIRFVDRHPEQRFVLNHLAKPVIDLQRFDADWGRDFRELARRENVVCKFSALTTEVISPEWSINALKPYWDVAVEAFGPERLMFGSDWPVSLLRTDYERWLKTVKMLASELSPSEQDSLFVETAKRAYRLT